MLWLVEVKRNQLLKNQLRKKHVKVRKNLVNNTYNIISRVKGNFLVAPFLCKGVEGAFFGGRVLLIHRNALSSE